MVDTQIYVCSAWGNFKGLLKFSFFFVFSTFWLKFNWLRHSNSLNGFVGALKLLQNLYNFSGMPAFSGFGLSHTQKKGIWRFLCAFPTYNEGTHSVLAAFLYIVIFRVRKFQTVFAFHIFFKEMCNCIFYLRNFTKLQQYNVISIVLKPEYGIRYTYLWVFSNNLFFFLLYNLV